MKAVIATGIDKNLVDPAKQFFSGVYHRGLWREHMLLLTYGVRDNDLNWFRERNILTYSCGHLADHTTQITSDAVFIRFFLFHPEIIRHWPIVVYYDADVIVNTRIDDLVRIKTFSAVRNLYCEFASPYLSHESSSERNEILLRYANRPVFAAGMFAFPTGQIVDGTFNRLVRLAQKYRRAVTWPDEIALNMVFPEWANLPARYNFLIPTSPADREFEKRLRGNTQSVIHCMGKLKPWSFSGHPLTNMWKSSLMKADTVVGRPFPGGEERWRGLTHRTLS